MSNFYPKRGYPPQFFEKSPVFSGYPPEIPQTGDTKSRKNQYDYRCNIREGQAISFPKEMKKVKGISVYVGMQYQHKFLCRLRASQRQVPIRYKHYIICGHIFQWLLSKKQKALKKSYKRKIYRTEVEYETVLQANPSGCGNLALLC